MVSVCTGLYGAEAVSTELTGAKATEAPVSLLKVGTWEDLECAGGLSGTCDPDWPRVAPAASTGPK